MKLPLNINKLWGIPCQKAPFFPQIHLLKRGVEGKKAGKKQRSKFREAHTFSFPTRIK
jgi:hypothetical protein